MKTLKLILITLVTTVFFSCTKEVDFNQIDDASIPASYISNLISFDLAPIKFLDDYNNEISWTSDNVETKITNDFEKYLDKVEFTVLTENSFNRSFLLEIIFFDENSNPIYRLQPNINILANSPSTQTIIEIPNEDIGVIFRTRYFGFIMNLSQSTDGSSLDGTEPYNLNFKSSIKLFFIYRKIWEK